MKRYSEYTPLVLLSLYTAKLMVVQTWSFPDAIVLLALSGVTALFQLKAKNDEIKEIQTRLIKQSEEIAKLQKQDEYLQTSVTSMRIATQSKPQAMKF